MRQGAPNIPGTGSSSGAKFQLQKGVVIYGKTKWYQFRGYVKT